MTRRTSKIAGAALAATLMTAGNALAEGTVLVELFTSQGCSSCPPADRMLKELKAMPGIVPLTLNVDYWDYLGWKDELASPLFTERQRAYARAMRSRRVYTPQMMLDGKMDVVGSRRTQVQSAVNSYLAEADPVSVTLTSQPDGRIGLHGAAKRPLDKAAVIWLVGYDDEYSSDITQGENAGERLTYTNVVREWRKAGDWDGAGALDMTMERPKGSGGCIAIVQEGEVGPVLGAANLEY